jgi:asparagine N-glycosylation enzyme membrane subunit Stt3
MIYPPLLETNLIFYMIVFMLMMTFMNLARHTFQQGYFSFADDTKVEILFGIKAFVICFVFITTWGSSAFFDFNLEKAHEETNRRVNMTLQLMGG